MRRSSQACRAHGETGRFDPPSHSMRSLDISVVCRQYSLCSTASAAEACYLGGANGSRQNGGESAEEAASGYAAPGNARIPALRMAWPIVARRLEGIPNISAMQLFDELCIQFPGRFTPRRYPALLRRVNRWREDARKRGLWLGTKTYRSSTTDGAGASVTSSRSTGQKWSSALRSTPIRPPLSYSSVPGQIPWSYSQRRLHTLQKRVGTWRQQAVQRLINEVSQTPNHAPTEACR